MTITLAHLLRVLAALLVAALAFGITAPPPAHACTLCSCSATTTNANFGTYDPTAAAPADTAGTVTINCTGLVALLGSVEVAASAVPGDAAVQFEGKTVGQATSLVLSPRSGKVAGFAILRREAVESVDKISVGGAPARVLSWTD